MLFRKVLVFTLMFFLLCRSGYSQNGIPYITHIDSREGHEKLNWAVCQDDHNNMLFANNRGLKSYDGSTWRLINIHHIPLKVNKNPVTGIVYIVSEKNVGYLERDEKGFQRYIPLTENGELANRSTDIAFTDSLVIFYSDRTISAYDYEDHRVFFRHRSKADEKFAGIIQTVDNIYTKIPGRGLFRVLADTLVATTIPIDRNDEKILFSLSHSPKEVLIGMSSGRLLLFDGKVFKNYPISNQNYLLENKLSNGIRLNGSTYVFSTLYGGVILVNREDGKVLNTLNYNTGLPDDEIYSMGVDNENGLWLTYRYGVCRVNFELPVKDYSNYPGIEGFFTGILHYNDELFVSTTKGLFYLAEVKNYENVEIYLKKDPPAESRSLKAQTQGTASVEDPGNRAETRDSGDEKEVEEEDKRGFFARLFRRGTSEVEKDEEDEKKTEPEPEEPVTGEPVSEPIKKQPRYEKTVISKLRSIEHIFKKVEGINNNCQHILATPYGILAGTSSGLFIVNDYLADSITGLRNINFIAAGLNDGYVVTHDNGVLNLYHDAGEWNISEEEVPIEGPLYSAWYSDSSTLWASGLDVVYKMDRFEQERYSIKGYPFESVFPEMYTLAFINDTLFLLSETRMRFYSPDDDAFLSYKNHIPGSGDFSSVQLFSSAKGDHWIKLDQEMVPLAGDLSEYKKGHGIFNLFDNINSFNSSDSLGYWLIDDYSKIFLVSLPGTAAVKHDFEIFLEQISNEAGEFYNLASPVFKPNEKLIHLNLTAPYFLKNNATFYQYQIDQRMDDWSRWTPESTLSLVLESGHYLIRIRAKNLMGEVSEPVVLELTIKPPFYKSNWFYISLIPFVLGLLYLVIFIRERKLRWDKHILEQKVEERTLEIQKQKQKIENQRNEILAQKNDITSSITYASRIQNAVLPARELFEKTFADYFIFYKPRDIVSGDFYWINQVGNDTVFAVADCTGHGVPGAFMSMLGNSFLNEITKKNAMRLSADQIMNRLRDLISDALKQSGELTSTHDGMDIALCVFNQQKKEIEFSGAYNPLYLVRNKELTIMKGDRMPIGYHPKQKDFTSESFKVKKGDILYLFTDGYPDQFGGPRNKKFTTGKFQSLLSELSMKPMNEQYQILEKTIFEWQGDNAQVDDILVIGLKI
ncbi:MAG: SpoIIE family protein phosphatase [Bacteroidales bacterium]